MSGRQVTYLSAEARERISRANAARWQDPDYRAHHLERLTKARKKSGRKGGRQRGTTHSPEACEKIRQTMKKRWQEPEFRARHLPHLLRMQAKAVEVRKAMNQGVPPEGTPERRQYNKLRNILGREAARATFKSAETDRAGAP